MSQPLVSRPPYGEGVTAVAELPSGGPSNRGLPLDPGIPGSSTYSKPVGDVRQPENQDESIYRVDDADSLTKDQDRIEVNEDNKDQNTSFNGLGKPDPATKTKYPYRDGVPNTHNAAFVAELWKLEGARTQVLVASSRVVVAATRDEILSGLDTKFQQRAKLCKALLKRVDTKNLRWIFAVDCGHGPRAVKIKAIPKAQSRQFSKLDLELSCSCPAWQWLGPEYHAKQEAFIIGKPRGTASTPDIRDPERDNRVCKHVAAALALTRQWSIPKPQMQKAVKKASQIKRALRRAFSKRADLVETARNILQASSAGCRVAWSDAPAGAPQISMRAQGDPERGPAKFQIRKEGQEWPLTWNTTIDLAGALGRLGVGGSWSKAASKIVSKLQE